MLMNKFIKMKDYIESIKLINNFNTEESINWILNFYNKKYNLKSLEEIEKFRFENYEKRKVEKKEYDRLRMNENYKENKEKINKKFNCTCGGKYTYVNKTKHFKTKKHLKYLEDNDK